MTDPRHVAVVDIGKTTAKLALVDLARLEEIDVRKRPNAVLSETPYPHYDTEGLWHFILDGLSDLHAAHGINAITVTTHGASAALLDEKGELAAPILDYECGGPDSLSDEYDSARPGFEESGSPRLPLGLNLGAQLFWQFRVFPEIRARTRTILTYPQYWAYRLCGVAVNEMTSLGCHTDLWKPRERTFSSLVKNEGWTDLMAPVAKAADRLGPMLHKISNATGLPDDTPVFCGIHDSNASLYAHLVNREAPFAVVSTGTWVISMAIGGQAVKLDPARDTLTNVNAFGDPVPSARFMGGREFERMMAGHLQHCEASDILSVLSRGAMLLPAVEIHSGPFQGQQYSWTADEANLSDGEHFAAVSFYLALMTATGLEMTGARGPILVEGPFANNLAYLDMLTAAARRNVHAVSGTGTSIGAALLTRKGSMQRKPWGHEDAAPDPSMEVYANRWKSLVADMCN